MCTYNRCIGNVLAVAATALSSKKISVTPPTLQLSPAMPKSRSLEILAEQENLALGTGIKSRVQIPNVQSITDQYQ